MTIPENKISFNEIERKISQIMNAEGRKMLREVLEAWDKELMESRDKEVYRHKGKQKTTVKTIMGEVEYSRVVYEIWGNGVKVGHGYLLDEAMGISCSGQLSDLLCAQIIEMSCKGSYRDASRTVSEMTGQTISHTTAWSVVQSAGKEIDGHEQRLAELASEARGSGDIETKVLFEEQDGISLYLQGKSRAEHGERKDMKLAIAYDGARKSGKNRYTLTNKVACANFEGIEDFVSRKEGVIAGAYNIDEVELRFLNGDGANWIRRNLMDDTIHYQLDTFHRNKWITEKVSDEAVRKTIMQALYSNDPELLLHVIEVEAISTDDEMQRENYMKLQCELSTQRASKL